MQAQGKHLGEVKEIMPLCKHPSAATIPAFDRRARQGPTGAIHAAFALNRFHAMSTPPVTVDVLAGVIRSIGMVSASKWQQTRQVTTLYWWAENAETVKSGRAKVCSPRPASTPRCGLGFDLGLD